MISTASIAPLLVSRVSGEPDADERALDNNSRFTNRGGKTRDGRTATRAAFSSTRRARTSVIRNDHYNRLFNTSPVREARA